MSDGTPRRGVGSEFQYGAIALFGLLQPAGPLPVALNDEIPRLECPVEATHPQVGWRRIG